MTPPTLEHICKANFLKSIDVSCMMKIPDLYCVLQVGANKGNVELF